MDEAEFVIDQVVHVGRHGEVDADLVAPGIVGEFAQFRLHDFEARRRRIVDALIMIDQRRLAMLVEQAMIGDPQRDRELAVAKQDVAAAGGSSSASRRK